MALQQTQSLVSLLSQILSVLVRTPPPLPLKIKNKKWQPEHFLHKNVLFFKGYLFQVKCNILQQLGCSISGSFYLVWLQPTIIKQTNKQINKQTNFKSSPLDVSKLSGILDQNFEVWPKHT